MVNSKLVQTRTKVNTKTENSTAHVTHLSFLYSELFNKCLEQKNDPLSSQVGHLVYIDLPPLTTLHSFFQQLNLFITYEIFSYDARN